MRGMEIRVYLPQKRAILADDGGGVGSENMGASVCRERTHNMNFCFQFAVHIPRRGTIKQNWEVLPFYCSNFSRGPSFDLPCHRFFMRSVATIFISYASKHATLAYGRTLTHRLDFIEK